MLFLSILLPWWQITSNIGSTVAPLWSPTPLQGWTPSTVEIRPNWYLILPVLMAALTAILSTGFSWKEGIAIYSAVVLVAPMQLNSAQDLLVNYFFAYLTASSAKTGSLGIGDYFTAAPGPGLMLYVLGYAVLTVLILFKITSKDNSSMERLTVVSILVIFSGLYWYLIGSMAMGSSPSWTGVMMLDTAFIVTTGILLWSTRRHGWLMLKSTWRERLQLTVLPVLVLFDAITTNYALPPTGPGGLDASGVSVRDASLLVNSVQSSGVPQVAFLFWTLLLLQVVALSYLTLGLASNTKLRSFPRFLASYALNMITAAYAFTVSNNLFLIFTGRTWFANSGSLVLVIALAVMLAFLLSVSSVWGLTRLGDLKRDWRVRF